MCHDARAGTMGMRVVSVLRDNLEHGYPSLR